MILEMLITEWLVTRSVEEILFAGSFCRYAKYIPNSYVKLDNFLIRFDDKKVNYIDRELSSNLNNIFVKLGAMLLASAYIDRYNGKNNSDLCDVHVNYHLCNFIFYTKSFLDAIAILLNDHYNLGFSKGDIDLVKKHFVDKMKSLHGTNITKEIIRKTTWIREVIDWRDSIIHRLSIIVAPLDPDTTKDYSAKMPVKPIKIFEEGGLSKLKQRHGASMQEVSTFCDKWIGNAKSLVESLGTDLLIHYNLS